MTDADDLELNQNNSLLNSSNKRTVFIVEDIGVEPMTLCVQGRCSSQLS